MPTYNFTVKKSDLDRNAQSDYAGIVKKSDGTLVSPDPFSLFAEDAANYNVSCSVDTSNFLSQRVQICLLDKDSEIITMETLWVDAAGEFDYRQMYDWNDGGRLDLILDSILAEVSAVGVDTDQILVDVAAVQSDVTLIGLDLASVKSTVEDTNADVNALNDVTAQEVWDHIVVSATSAGSVQADWAEGGRLDVILDQVLTNTGAGGGQGDVNYAVPDKITDPRTFFIRGASSLSTPQVNTFSAGVVTLAIDMDRNDALNPGTTIASLLIAQCVHRASQTPQATDNYLVQQNRRKANFDITGPMSNTGYYDVTADVTTSDGQKLVVTGSFNVPE